MVRFIDLTGQTFGMLTAISRTENDKNGGAKWNCKCKCGNSCVSAARDLKRDYSASCGCELIRLATLRVIANNKKRATHGDKRGHIQTKEYTCWIGLRDRCNNPKCVGYVYYGGRGISVCERWTAKGGFTAFLADMGRAPSPQHSIDRINNDGNYEPGNCRWATASEQRRNQRPRKRKQRTNSNDN